MLTVCSVQVDVVEGLSFSHMTKLWNNSWTIMKINTENINEWMNNYIRSFRYWREFCWAAVHDYRVSSQWRESHFMAMMMKSSWALNLHLPLSLLHQHHFSLLNIFSQESAECSSLWLCVCVWSWLQISAPVNRGYSLVSIAAVSVARLCVFSAEPRRVDQSRPAVGKHSIYTCRTPLQLLLLLESRLFVWMQR